MTDLVSIVITIEHFEITIVLRKKSCSKHTTTAWVSGYTTGTFLHHYLIRVGNCFYYFLQRQHFITMRCYKSLWFTRNLFTTLTKEGLLELRERCPIVGVRFWFCWVFSWEFLNCCIIHNDEQGNPVSSCNSLGVY